MKVKIKYTGPGITSRGVDFDADKNGGLYDVDKADAEYLLKTFPDNFVLIERKAEEPKKTTKRKPRKASTADKED